MSRSKFSVRSIPFVLLAIVVGWAAYVTLAYPKVIGGKSLDNKRIAVSPDSQFTAFAFTKVDMSFWGTKWFYYEYVITHSADYSEIRTFVVVPPVVEPTSDYAMTGKFQWLADSTGLEIGMFGAELKLYPIDLK